MKNNRELKFLLRPLLALKFNMNVLTDILSTKFSAYERKNLLYDARIKLNC